jgi:hypothetical protein
VSDDDDAPPFTMEVSGRVVIELALPLARSLALLLERVVLSPDDVKHCASIKFGCHCNRCLRTRLVAALAGSRLDGAS